MIIQNHFVSREMNQRSVEEDKCFLQVSFLVVPFFVFPFFGVSLSLCCRGSAAFQDTFF